ncbi:NUDIX domain-containing protein [bacterium]|nr:NUDIX domain-containing protein [bacterium]
MDSAHSHTTNQVTAHCPLCQSLAEGANHPEFICELSHVVVSRGPFSGRWPGALQVTSKRHLRDPSQLKYPHFIHSQNELYAIETAIRKVTRAHHMNVVKFGNVVEHLHWHLIPRFSNETHPQKTPWELSDLPAQALVHTSSTTSSDHLYAEIVSEISLALRERQPPYFATALFIRPLDRNQQAGFLQLPLSQQHSAVRASPEAFECFLMQRNYLDFAWDSFGGEADAGETPAQTLQREIREELGWELESWLEVTRQWAGGMLRGFVYLAQPSQGLLLQAAPKRAACDEVKQALWHPLQDLLTNPMSVYSAPVVGRARALVAGEPDFSL